MILKEVKHNKIQRSKSIIICMKFYQFKLFIILIKDVNHNNLQGPLSNLNKIKIIKKIIILRYLKLQLNKIRV